MEALSCTNRNKIAKATINYEKLQFIKLIVIQVWPEVRNKIQDKGQSHANLFAQR